MTLLDACIGAHGGREAFKQLGVVDFHVRSKGLALAIKMRPRALADVQATVNLSRPIWVSSISAPGMRRTPDQHTCRGASHGTTPTSCISGYALWNYLAAPFAWERCGVRELPERRLALTFPADFPTHFRSQIAHLDENARNIRLDYTAEVFGPWARA